MLIFLGWLLGLSFSGLAAAALLLTLGIVLPLFLTALAAPLAAVIAALGAGLVLAIAVLVLAIGFVIGYSIATAGIAPLLPGATGLAAITFPLGANVPTPGAAAVTVPASAGEFFGRGLLIGLSAGTNAIVLSALPRGGLVLAAWAFVVISLAAVVAVARSRVYQGFLGWSGWLFPLAYLATGVGLLLFLVSIPFAFATFGSIAIATFAIDWTTGVIETRGGPAGITGFDGGFSLGNFTFLTGPSGAAAGPAPARFITHTLSSHETGHSLNTAAMGGVVLWINAVDENLAPQRKNLAYGELHGRGACAQHARSVPP